MRRILRTAVPQISEPEISELESELTDLFMEYAAEHYKLIAKEEP